MSETKHDKELTVYKTTKEWRDSFRGNNNTGIKEEIDTGIEILTNADFSKISGIINLTQSDDVGGTADTGIKYKDGTIEYYSVTQWKNQTSKCICNTSATERYNLDKSEKSDNMNKKAYEMAVDYRKKQCGENPNKKWKRTQNCPGAKLMA